MARINIALKNTETTHEGAAAARMTALQALRRSVLATMLFEDTFYESGEEIGARIVKLVREVKPEEAYALAVEAREQMNLRHAPLLVTAAMAKNFKGAYVGATVQRVVQRADELTELLALIAKINGVTPDKLKGKLSAQVKKGLAAAFKKFDEYQLAKYDREGAVRLRDALFLSHPKPETPEQEALWKRLVANELVTPDTWETNLSAGADKKETFTRLLTEGKLGYLALLRNLRNMEGAGVDRKLVEDAILARKGAQRVLPFRFLSAAKHAVSFEPVLDKALMATLADLPELPGETIVCVDVSGSMGSTVSGRSEVHRFEAAAALASLVRGNVRLFAFGTNVKELPHRLGMAGIAEIGRWVGSFELGSGTEIGKAIATAVSKYGKADRIIVITDEQSHDPVGVPAGIKHRYMVNVASYQNGVGYGGWVHLDGFSEATLKWIVAYEAEQAGS